jgi:hypothetical protein
MCAVNLPFLNSFVLYCIEATKCDVPAYAITCGFGTRKGKIKHFIFYVVCFLTGPPLGPSLLAHHLPASSHRVPAKGRFLSCLTLTLHLSSAMYRIPPSAIGSLSHLSSPIPHCSTKVYLERDCYITCYPLAHGLFISLKMEAVHTSETSDNFNVTTRRYIPEDSNLVSY